jgi:hypothetical protein
MMSLQKDYILLQILVEDDYTKLFGRVRVESDLPRLDPHSWNTDSVHHFI